MGALWDQVDITHNVLHGFKVGYSMDFFLFFPIFLSFSGEGGLGVLSESLIMSLIQTFIGRTSVLSILYNQGWSNNEAWETESVELTKYTYSVVSWSKSFLPFNVSL